jgi:hypothetical protein
VRSRTRPPRRAKRQFQLPPTHTSLRLCRACLAPSSQFFPFGAANHTVNMIEYNRVTLPAHRGRHMHSATTATGRSLPPPGKTLPENRPAPLTSPVTHHLAAPKPYVTSDLQCYIPLLIDNDRRSPLKINRQPRRLESAKSSTKQTPAPQINRQ